MYILRFILYNICIFFFFVDIYLSENNFSGQPFQYYDTGQSLSVSQPPNKFEQDDLHPYTQYQQGGRHIAGSQVAFSSFDRGELR